MRQQMTCPAWRWMLFTPVTSRPSTSLPWHERNKRTQSCKTPRIPRSSCAQSTADTTLLCDMSTGTPRPYVPQPLHRVVFDALPSLSHPGIRATQHLVTARYVWPHINANVRKWARSCLQWKEPRCSSTPSPLLVPLHHLMHDSIMSTWTLNHPYTDHSLPPCCQRTCRTLV